MLVQLAAVMEMQSGADQPTDSAMTNPQGFSVRFRRGFSTSFSNISGWWLTYPPEKYESQLGLVLPTYGKIKHVPEVPNHQPDLLVSGAQVIDYRCFRLYVYLDNHQGLNMTETLKWVFLLFPNMKLQYSYMAPRFHYTGWLIGIPIVDNE